MTGLIMPAYAFPRDMPVRADGVAPFESAQFEPMYQQSVALTRGSLVQVADLAPPLWQMEFQCHVLDDEDAQRYLAWLQSLRGGTRLFKAWHPLCDFPQHYEETGWTGLVVAGSSPDVPFDGVGTLASIGSQRDTMTVSGLPSAFQIRIGDMCSIQLGTNSRTLHRLMANATANGAGVASLVIEPMLPLSLSAETSPSPEVLFEKPYCLAVLDAKSVRGPWQGNRMARVQFSALSTF